MNYLTPNETPVKWDSRHTLGKG